MRTLIAAVALLTACSTAYGWGHKGHEVVGAIADRMLEENAKQQVQAILGGTSLQEAARWADCVKDVDRQSDGTFEYHPMQQFHAACVVFETPDGIARMEDYVSRNFDNCAPPPGADPCHKQYHYTDVAIQHSDYKRTFVGTSDHDIVSARSGDLGSPRSARFSTVQH